MLLISGDDSLSAFREMLTVQRAVELLLDAKGRRLVQLPVGVGKSRWLDEITLTAFHEYDLMIVLCPTRRLIDERGPLAQPPTGLKVVNIRPRPANQCGAGRDLEWK